jgi:predicted nucleotidyltransferase
LALLPAGYHGAVAQMEATFEQLLGTMKHAAATLRDADVPFVLGGGLAIWARGGPETEHDVDFFVRPDDARAAASALQKAGFRTEEPPEGWLYKAFADHVMVDLIFAPNGMTIDGEFLARAEVLEVHAVRVPVMSADDVLVAKLLTLREHQVDYDQVLEIARNVREQIDWDDVRARTGDSPYAKAFFTLVDELGISG